MRKLMLLGSMAAGLLLAAAVSSNQAAAMTLGTPIGVRVAVDAMNVAEPVHCVPGFVHRHYWGWGTGCAVARPGVVVVRPAYRPYHRHYYRRGLRRF